MFRDPWRTQKIILCSGLYRSGITTCLISFHNFTFSFGVFFLAEDKAAESVLPRLEQFPREGIVASNLTIPGASGLWWEFWSCSVQGQGLDSMILVGLVQLRTFCDSLTLQLWGFCWDCKFKKKKKKIWVVYLAWWLNETEIAGVEAGRTSKLSWKRAAFLLFHESSPNWDTHTQH